MKSFAIELILLFAWASFAMGADIPSDTISAADGGASQRHRSWHSLLPTQLVVQNAGNMGWLSAGVGWSYGRSRQWETHLLVGFVPKYKSGSAKPTFTIKENFMPWRIMLNQRMMLEPLSCGLYVNTIGGGQFWSHLPSRYPNNYYLYSTRFRINVFMGERVTWTFGKGRKGPRSITAFYELSTCDLYLLDFFGNRSVKAKDIVGLSLGVKLQVF